VDGRAWAEDKGNCEKCTGTWRKKKLRIKRVNGKNEQWGKGKKWKEEGWNGKKGEGEGESKSSYKGRNGQAKIDRGIRQGKTD
jgi:hypothetical protein